MLALDIVREKCKGKERENGSKVRSQPTGMKSHLLACTSVNRLHTILCFPTTLQFKRSSHTECECSCSNPIRFLFPLLIDKTVKTLC